MTINMIIELKNILSIKVISLLILYKTIYWQGIYIGDWQFFRKFANIKITNN